MADKKPETIDILGKQCEVTIKKDGNAFSTLHKGDFDAVLAEKGVTKEVRDVCTKAVDDIVSEVSKAETEFLIAHNKGLKEDDPKYVKSFEARLGSGNFSMSVSKIPHKVHTGTDIKTGKPYETHKYGITKFTVNVIAAPEFRKEGGQSDKEAEAFMKSLGAKKK